MLLKLRGKLAPSDGVDAFGRDVSGDSDDEIADRLAELLENAHDPDRISACVLLVAEQEARVAERRGDPHGAAETRRNAGRLAEFGAADRPMVALVAERLLDLDLVEEVDGDE